MIIGLVVYFQTFTLLGEVLNHRLALRFGRDVVGQRGFEEEHPQDGEHHY